MTIPDRLTLRLGPLAQPLERELARTGQTPSEYIRSIIAADLRQPRPKMPTGKHLTGGTRRRPAPG